MNHLSIPKAKTSKEDWDDYDWLSVSREEGELHEQNWDSITKERGGGAGPATGNAATYLKIILMGAPGWHGG